MRITVEIDVETEDGLDLYEFDHGLIQRIGGAAQNAYGPRAQVSVREVVYERVGYRRWGGSTIHLGDNLLEGEEYVYCEAPAPLRLHERVVLRGDPGEGWEREEGTIIGLDEREWGTGITVELDYRYRDGSGRAAHDDGIREVTEDQIAARVPALRSRWRNR